jgi:Trypsin
MRKRVVRVGAVGVIGAAGALVACGSQGTGKEITVASSANPANVVIDLRDGSGVHIGSCTGMLISSSVVLTAGHCVVAAKEWVISTANGAQTANGSQVFTTWQDFESTWSHPQHSDVALILLDRSMFVSKYPTLARSLTTDGTRLSRVRRVDATSVGATSPFEEVAGPVIMGNERGFPLAYVDVPSLAEDGTDTGGALYDPDSNTVYGVVSGRGLTTGNIYVSRVDYLSDWVEAVASCDPEQTIQCHPTGSSGGSGSGSSSGGTCSGSSSGGTCSGSSSGGTCSGSSSGGTCSGSSSGGTCGGSSSGGSGGSGSSSGGGGGCHPPPPPNPPSGGMDAGGSSGSSGGASSGSSGSGMSSGSSGAGASSGSSGGSNSSGSGGGVGLPEGGIVLPPDGPGCTSPNCGGCGDDPSCGDNQQDYGNCGCTPNPTPGFEAGPNQ